VKRIYQDRAKKRKVRRLTVQVKNTMALPGRAKTVATCLQRVNAVFRKLFSDENFITILEAESLTTIPGYISPLLEEARNGNEIC
jgi:hypothetical protein